MNALRILVLASLFPLGGCVAAIGAVGGQAVASDRDDGARPALVGAGVGTLFGLLLLLLANEAMTGDRE